MNTLKILFVEDVRNDAELIWHELEKNNITFTRKLVDKKDDYIHYLEKFNPDIIISDYFLPQFDGMSALLLRNEMTPLTPFIIVTGSINEEIAVECMKAGADDYVLKEKLSRLSTAVLNTINRTGLLREKKTAEDELRKSNLLFKKAQSIAHIGSWELDLSTKSIRGSDEAVKIYGFDIQNNIIPLDLVQKSVLPEYRAMLNETLDNLLYYNEPYEADFKIIRANDGAIRSIYSKAELIPVTDNNKVNVIGVIQDITDRKENEDELIMAKEKAEEGDRLKTAFLHNISHEIRTPMNAIIGFSALLEEPGVDEQIRKSYTEIIIQSSNHLLAIITDIVEISNIEANLIRIVKDEINLNSRFKTLYNQFIPKTIGKKLELTYETALSNSDALIITDGTKLFQILLNLINNAFKFTSKGQIKLGYKVQGDFLEFSVSDTGIGISPEDHEKIFDRFYQVQHTTSRAYEGTGLGLSISKAYVEYMGGKIWLESEPDKGSIFYFTIPYEKLSSTRDAASDIKPAKSHNSRNKKTILVAEDIESNFEMLR
ncbi:MAG: ATP-binding protein [Bacteroidota bacterium]